MIVVDMRRIVLYMIPRVMSVEASQQQKTCQHI